MGYGKFGCSWSRKRENLTEINTSVFDEKTCKTERAREKKNPQPWME